MGRFSGRGEYLSGIAGGPMAVDGQPIGALGHGVWYGDDILAGAQPAGLAWGLWHFAGPDRAPIPLGYLPGATSIGATRELNFAATYESQPQHRTFGSWRGGDLPPTCLAGHLLDGHDDTLVFSSADFQRLLLLYDDGQTNGFDARFVARDVRAIEGGCVYLDGQTLMLYLRGSSAPVPVQTFGVAGEPYSFTFDRARWFFYHNERGIFLHRLGEMAGHRFPAGFHPDVYIGGQDKIGYSTNEEGLDGIRTLNFELGVGMAPFIQMPTFGPFNHAVLVAPYKDPNGESGAGAEIAVNHLEPFPGRPYFLGDEDALGDPALLLGKYSEASDTPAADIALARQLNTRVLLMRDSAGPWPTVLLMRPYDILGRELYLDRLKRETIQESIERWHLEVGRLLNDWPGQIALALQFYCMGGAPPNELWSEQDVLDGMAAMTDIINRSVRITVVAPFEFLRGNGIYAHPVFLEALERLLDAAERATEKYGPVVLPPMTHADDVPQPVPQKENDDMPKIGQKGAFRPWGSLAMPTRAEVAAHDHDSAQGFVAVKINGKPTNFPSLEPRDSSGAGERVYFDGKVMLALPGDDGAVYVYEWFNLPS